MKSIFLDLYFIRKDFQNMHWYDYINIKSEMYFGNTIFDNISDICRLPD